MNTRFAVEVDGTTGGPNGVGGNSAGGAAGFRITTEYPSLAAIDILLVGAIESTTTGTSEWSG
jgi:hypothetical protein